MGEEAWTDLSEGEQPEALIRLRLGPADARYGGDLVAGAKGAVAYYGRYPSTKEGKDALVKAAQTYESLGLLAEAAATLRGRCHGG